MTAIIWFYRYHNLQAEAEPDIESAAAFAVAMEDNGNGVAVGIEHDGTFIARDTPEWDALTQPIEDEWARQRAAEQAEWDATPRTVVEIDPPDGIDRRRLTERTAVAWCTPDQLATEVAKWQNLVGAERVHTRPNKTTR